MISLFVLKALHSVTMAISSTFSLLLTHSVTASLASLLLFKNGRHLRVLVFHCLECLSPSYLHGLHPH